MAFDKTGFGDGGPAKKGNAPIIYTYQTADTIATVNTEGYFNDLSDTLAVGDLIYVVSSTGGTRVSTLTQVLSNTSGVVDVADGTTLAATDGD
jgi:hypothetical protein